MTPASASALLWTRTLLLAPLVLTVVLAKFSVPPFSSMGLGVALPLVLALTAVAVVAGAFEIHRGRLMWYLAMVTWAGLTQLGGRPFSLASMAFLAVLFVPYVLQLKAPPGSADLASTAQRAFAALGAVLALGGVLQYLIQQVAGPEVAFPIEHLLPKGLLIERFNVMNPLHYGSPIFKSNGIFFLEPSFFSQFLAIAILVELSAFNRLHRIGLMLAAIACTFSGTGLIALTSGLGALAIASRRWNLLAGAALALGIAVTFSELLRLDIFLERASEFSRAGTSGFERFVAWITMAQDLFAIDTSRAWWGMGAGSFYGLQQVARYSVAEMPFAKMLIEFGIPGFFLYFAFIFYGVASSEASPGVKVGVGACLLMNGAYSESNTGVLLTLLLWPGTGRQRTQSGATSFELRWGGGTAVHR